jgi:hypothetical protein
MDIRLADDEDGIIKIGTAVPKKLAAGASIDSGPETGKAVTESGMPAEPEAAGSG